MPELLIIEACVVSYADDKGGIHQDAGDKVNVNKETALALTRAGRALYTNKADDADKHGRYTASKDMLKAAEDLAKSKAAPVKQPPTPPAA